MKEKSKRIKIWILWVMGNVRVPRSMKKGPAKNHLFSTQMMMMMMKSIALRNESEHGREQGMQQKKCRSFGVHSCKVVFEESNEVDKTIGQATHKVYRGINDKVDAVTFQMQRYKALEKAWFNYGVREFCLVLTSKVDGGDKILKLEAKIKISMEYPRRPPPFSLSLDYGFRRGNCDNGAGFQWSKKLRAMEAEVNLNMFNILPLEQESQTVAHQVYFLTMMFDYMVDEISPSSEKSEATSIIDVGLCKPVSGKLLARSVREGTVGWRH